MSPMTTAAHDTARLEFSVRGQRVAGIFRSPHGRPGARVPGVVLTGPFTGVDRGLPGQGAGRAAEVLQLGCGVLVLAGLAAAGAEVAVIEHQRGQARVG